MPHTTEQTYDLIGLGRAYIDVIAPVSYRFLEEHGIPLDTGAYFDAQAIRSLQDSLTAPSLCAGGAIPNTVAGLAALGAKTGYCGNVADDSLGHAFSKDLKTRGIDALGPPPLQGVLSGTCLVLLTEGGERSFALHKGCVDAFDKDALSALPFFSTRYVLFGANLLSDAETAPLVAQTIERAQANACTLVASVSEVRSWTGRESYAKDIVARQANIIIGNEAEMDALLETTGAIDNPETILVTTRGAQGSSARQGTTLVHGKATTPHPNFVNSLGAGDQFLAGFLMAQILGKTLEESLALGTRCADAIIAKNEARPSAHDSWAPFLP